jgi:hypothetical protein
MFPSLLGSIHTGLVLYVPYITLAHLYHQNHLLLQPASYSDSPFFLLFYFLASLLLVRNYSFNSLTPTGGIGVQCSCLRLLFDVTTTIPK